MNLLNSLFSLISPCFNFITELFSRSYECQESHSSSSSGVSELPPSVLLEIFVILPINSIIRCRCVCKSWQNLICDPYFANVYLKNPQFTAIALTQHYAINKPLDSMRFFIVEIGRNGDVTNTPFNSKAINFPTAGLGIRGSCNGLLFLVQSPLLENENHDAYVYNRDDIYNNQTLYIINPLIGEHMVLPKVQGAKYIRDVIYGFSSSTNNAHYKVLRIVIRYVVTAYSQHELAVDGKILTVGVDQKWRDFEDSSIPCFLFQCGVNLNGVCHWVGDDRRSGLIYAFDFEEERGGQIPLPPGLVNEAGNVVIVIWNDRLCLIDNSNEHRMNIWTMREYGVAESWTKDFVVRSLIPQVCLLINSFPLQR